MDGSAKCDLVETSKPDDLVWGVVFDIDSVEKSSLDDAEGLGYGYAQKQVDELPADYLALIEQVESTEDPDRDRHDRELSIYR